jgi:S-adenosylmethionine:tRNA ribosyltransferase-isomerase
MKTSLFDYHLPKKFIAQEPVESRDSSKLMIYNVEADSVQHKHFYDLSEILDENDVLVVNKSKVIPARIIFKENDKEYEVFLLRDLGRNRYKTLVKPGRFFKIGKKFHLNNKVFGIVEEILDDGARIIKFNENDLKRFGQVPLPPYIKNKKVDFSKYQTVYASKEGSVAAPTAGLHFTDQLLEKLRNKGVELEEIILHIGRGTFLPVSTDSIKDHVMHSEFFEFDKAVASRLNIAKKSEKRIVAVGTTSVRVLESCYLSGKGFIPKQGETDIFIYPSYKWKAVDALITNFHLPKSTLIMLVASFLQHKGLRNEKKAIQKILDLYELAKNRNYRFYSFGDAMMIV